jgi:glycosyltransferase involved in cell wall biosynthesis
MTLSPEVADIALSWHGLPQFAAWLFRDTLAQLEQCGLKGVVIGTPPDVPVRGMERALGREIHWIEASKPKRWIDLGLAVPKVFVQSGWSYPALSSLGAEVKRAGGRIIGLSDANWRGDPRQLLLGPIAFRLSKRRYFDAMIVPGRQGERLMRWFGMSPNRVRVGMLGADPSQFSSDDDVALRQKQFLYVGQFIARKNVLGLARAFLRFAERHPDWSLRLCGSGAQRGEIPQDSRIQVEDFVQPEDLPSRYRQARFFVLPSTFEAWGVVVHEAALSGCGLLLSDRVGSADDLCTSTNGLRFRAGDVSDLERALNAAAQFDSTQLRQAGAESRRLAAKFGPETFGRAVKSLLTSFSET